MDIHTPDAHYVIVAFQTLGSVIRFENVGNELA